MTRSQTLRLWLIVGLSAVAAGVAGIALILTSNHAGNQIANGVLIPLIGWSYVLCGLVAWTRRPENGTGKILVLIGFSWFAPLLVDSSNSFLYTLGQLVGSIVLAAFVHLLVSYPSGKLDTRLERELVPVGYALAIVANATVMLFDPQSGCPTKNKCPANDLVVAHHPTVANVLLVVWDIAAVIFFVFVGVALVRRWRRSTATARRQIRNVIYPGAAAVLLLTISFALDPVSHAAKDIFATISLLIAGTLPYFILGRMLGSRLARGGVAELLVRVRETTTLDETQDALRDALRDPRLWLGVWVPERGTYVGTDGRPFTVPESDVARVSTLIAGEDGAPVAVLVHDRSILDEPELLEAVVAAARLSLERNRLQADLRARLDELQRERDFIASAVNASPAFFAVMDMEGGIVRFNDALVNASGVKDDEGVRGRPFWEVFVSEGDADAVRDAIVGCVPGEQESHWRTKDGEAVVAWSMTPISDGQGRDRLLLTGLDVSERVRHEDQLRRERDFLTIVSEATPSLLCAIHRDGTFDQRGVNAAFTAATGLRDEDVVGRKFWDLVIPEAHVETVREAIEHAVETGEETRLETPWRGIGGRELLVEWWTVTLARYRDGHFLICGTDITGRKHAEDEVRRSRARLVEAADAERRRLERNLHDGAQQRLVSLSLALRLAEARLDDPEAAAQVLQGAGKELSLALQELRELARGLHPAILTDRGLDAALESIAERSPVPVTLELDVDGRLPGAVEVAIFYVVSESLANVAKYSGAGSAVVRVAKNGERVRVEVADDGVGGADPAHGSGLRGLVDRVDAVDGRLAVDSPRGGGTRVVADLPLSS
jgi:PAS domain S-box-containing protein